MSDDVHAPEVTLGRIETEVALLMRLGEATRRGTGTMEHRLLDRAAYVILRHLDAAGPQNVSALAARLNLDGSTVTRQVSALQRDGLISRTPDPADGRGTVISATAAGLQRMAAVRAARTRLYGDILAAWPEADRETLADMLHRLNEALDTRNRRR
ncbi:MULTISPECIES: MarR family winged helix-turn-helix transcriptional regulator [Micromonospora]|uniref:Transcriptional regulator n=1 Tax=Micromonospora aurantiaca (nom. illeg.) TaxID=47850 RepID=A0A3M9KDL8_9ACTN|nr:MULTISPECIES: MarR family transcriptional regulator [Micromonospora]ADU09157.1 regulatory protein MarR [Micromonospora sp. L5]AXH94209.1 transcriptional regulator [Micromonospora aurantiaca]MBC9001113.1 MarR family transcriptional regulator [Micromonospora aurantiaca]RNH98352.1 MarR family transcriptional regulator [Micromonospora aurantiaca]